LPPCGRGAPRGVRPPAERRHPANGRRWPVRRRVETNSHPSIPECSGMLKPRQRPFIRLSRGRVTAPTGAATACRSASRPRWNARTEWGRGSPLPGGTWALAVRTWRAPLVGEMTSMLVVTSHTTLDSLDLATVSPAACGNRPGDLSAAQGRRASQHKFVNQGPPTRLPPSPACRSLRSGTPCGGRRACSPPEEFTQWLKQPEDRAQIVLEVLIADGGALPRGRRG
jgi:hypothetical protein